MRIPGVEIRNFSDPDKTTDFQLGYMQEVAIGQLPLGRTVVQPGWRWSTHVKPIVKTERCEFHHIGFMLSGQLAIETKDGAVQVIEPGDAFDIAPGHDAWVVGDELSVSIYFQGLTGYAAPPEAGERILTTILFTDIVESTAAAERIGDAAWKRLLAQHHEDLRSLLSLHRGQEVKSTGDGILATFASPAGAIRAAIGISEAASRLGIQVRAGVHTGEVELTEGDLGGVSVHLAARVMAAAGSGEVFVSGTSRELANGSGLEFVDRGVRELKGISEPRQLFEARLTTP